MNPSAHYFHLFVKNVHMQVLLAIMVNTWSSKYQQPQSEVPGSLICLETKALAVDLGIQGLVWQSIQELLLTQGTHIPRIGDYRI